MTGSQRERNINPIQYINNVPKGQEDKKCFVYKEKGYQLLNYSKDKQNKVYKKYKNTLVIDLEQSKEELD